MGLILDSSVLIAAERKAQPVSELLTDIRAKTGLTEILHVAKSKCFTPPQQKWIHSRSLNALGVGGSLK